MRRLILHLVQGKPESLFHQLRRALPEYRHQGIGRRLLEACEERLTTPRLRLCVRPSNEEAIRMYKMAGYSHVDRWGKYYNDGEDSLVMEKLKVVQKESVL